MTRIAGTPTVITGAGSGLGRLLAYAIARLGGVPILLDIAERGLEGTADEIEGATGERPSAYICDVTDPTTVGDVARRIREEVGDPGIVINNAGVVSGAPLLEMSDEHIRRTLQVNTHALFWVTRAFLGPMVERDRGHVITIASAAGWVGVPRQTDYAASKFGAVGFDEALRMELRRTAPGIRTTLVCPYYVSTGMFEGVTTRFSWLLPIMEPRQVVTRIVDAILRDRRRVFLPPIVGALPALRVLPTDLFDRTMDLLGVTEGMDHFHGRT